MDIADFKTKMNGRSKHIILKMVVREGIDILYIFILKFFDFNLKQLCSSSNASIESEQRIGRYIFGVRTSVAMRVLVY
jgi:hypothetical protein